MSALAYWNKLKLWQKVLVGMLLGIAVGHYMGKDALFFKPFGTVFVNMIKMVVVPLVFFSILNGITSIGDANTFGRIGGKAALAYMCTTIFAVIIGLSFGTYFEPGVGVNLVFGEAVVN